MSASGEAVHHAAAPLWRRALATLIDLAVPLTVWALGTWALVATDPTPLEMAPWNLFDQVVDYLHDRPGRAVVAVMLMVGMQVAWPLAFPGGTPGKRVMQVTLVDRHGAPTSRRRILAWALVRVPSVALAGIGLWWALVDPERRTLHDRAAGLWCVRAAAESAEQAERQV